MSKTKRRHNRKGRVRGPAKARRLRCKRKLTAQRRLASVVTDVPRPERPELRMRGDGPPVRNVEASGHGKDLGKECGNNRECAARADTMVFWEFWLGGYWRLAARHRCQRHASQIAARLRKARAQ